MPRNGLRTLLVLPVLTTRFSGVTTAQRLIIKTVKKKTHPEDLGGAGEEGEEWGGFGEFTPLPPLPLEGV